MKLFKKILIILIILLVFIFIMVMGINYYIKISTSKMIYKKEDVKKEEYDCALVLGAGLRNNKPSPVLKDRLDVAIYLYKEEIVSKLIMSGDHGKEDYDEVNVMKNYAISNGVKSSDIFMDHAGFSTYDSIYRAKEIFKVEKMLIVTQKFHLPRSLYLAKKIGIEAYGVSATLRNYENSYYFELREILARNKDFFKGIFKPKPVYLGSEIPVSSNGDITND